MKSLIVFLSFVLIAGCSGIQLKKCPNDPPEDVMECGDPLINDYAMCQKNEKLRAGCHDPQ